MATSEDIYNEFAHGLLNNTITEDLGTADIKVALLDSNHTPSLNTNAVFSDVSTNEVSGTGYTSGGQSISAFGLTTGTRTVDADGDDVEWTNSTITASYAVVYNASPSAGSQNLIMLVDFGGSQSSSDASFTVSWDAAGIFRFDTNPA